MLVFDVYRDGAPAPTASMDLSGAYLMGQESVPIRAEIAASDGRITCKKRAEGASALALLWEVPSVGKLLLPTTRLPERRKPYNLNLELARSRMTSLIQKREDWGLFDLPAGRELADETAGAGKMFIEALKINGRDMAKSSQLADACLAKTVDLSEKTALFHADLLLARRRQTNSFARPTLGCVVDLFSHSKAYRQRLAAAFDLISLPVSWKQIEPRQGKPRFEQLDAWMDWCSRNRLAAHTGPLLSFEPDFFPDWIYIWEHDYETLREMVYEHIQRVVSRYEKRVNTWNVISAAHSYNHFNLNFEQIMELTRMSCSLVKKLAPQATVVVDVALPWGEYYARNQRTIPPMMYADMCVQSGVKFDAFGLQMFLGAATDGLYVRDLMQISTKLDEFAAFDKLLHISACQVPSNTAADKWDHWKGQAGADRAGTWRKAWDAGIQAEWIEAFYKLALSKPFVETVSWRDLADYEGHYLPHGGLCRNDLAPKPGYEAVRRIRAALTPRADGNGSADRRNGTPPQEA